MGPIALPLDTFAEAKMTHLQHKQWPYYGGFSHATTEFLLETAILPFVDIARIRKQIRDRTASLSLAELRLQLSRRAATVDHDQVFSLLGVADYLRGPEEKQTPQAEDRVREPNYNHPPTELYKVISQQHIHEKSNLLPLSISSHKESHPETPSWVVDWTILQGASLSFDQLLWTRGYILFHADRGMTAAPRTVRWPDDRNIYELQLEGRAIDRIAISTPFASLFDDENVFLQAIRKHDPTLPYPGAEGTTWSDAWFRCLTADSVTTNDSYYEGRNMSQPHRLHEDPDEEGFKMRGSYLLATHDPWIRNASERNCDKWDETRSIWGKYRWHGNVPPHSPEVNRLRELREALNAQVAGVTKGRMIFLTEQGYLGVTNKCEVGDEIYVAGGGNMPILLRRYAEVPEKMRGYYRVISDCYLHGFMDGEHTLTEPNSPLRRLNIL